MQETNTYAFFEKKNRAGILPCHKSTAWDNGKFDFVKQILTQMKALIARDLFDSSAYYRIINDIDDIFSKGLEVITNDKLYYQLIDTGRGS